MKCLALLPMLLIIFSSISVIAYNVAYGDNWVLPKSPWGCPPKEDRPNPPAPTIDKDNDGKPDRLYIHLIDENGNDIQEWCLDHGRLGDYGYYISAPGKEDTKVGGCLLICGGNIPIIDTTGNVTITTLNGTEVINATDGSFTGTVSGTITGNVNGTITFFNHTNYVPRNHIIIDPEGSGRLIINTHSGKDYHFYYNYTTGDPPLKMWTKILENGTHKITKTVQMAMIPHQTPDEHLVAQEVAFLERGLPGFVNSNMPGERGITPDEHIVHSQDIVSGDSTYKILFSNTSPIDNIVFESKDNILKINLKGIEQTAQVNLSIPRNLIDHTLEESFEVLTDGEIKTPFSEDTSLSHRTLTVGVKPGTSYLLIDSPSKSIVSQIPVTNTYFVVGYQISNGDITKIVPSPETSSLIIGVNSSGKGELTLGLIRNLIDSKIDNVDGDLIILINGEPTNEFKESRTSTDRTLIISFPDGTEQIEIIGTFVVPEFGVISSLILAVAIVSIIAISFKTRLNFITRF